MGSNCQFYSREEIKTFAKHVEQYRRATECIMKLYDVSTCLPDSSEQDFVLNCKCKLYCHLKFRIVLMYKVLSLGI